MSTYQNQLPSIKETKIPTYVDLNMKSLGQFKNVCLKYDPLSPFCVESLTTWSKDR